MTDICEHEFIWPDKEDPNYSQTEFDLTAKLDMSIRKNLASGEFEIAKISTKQMVHHGTLEQMVARANELEGCDYIKIGCNNIICRAYYRNKKDKPEFKDALGRR